MKTIKFRLRLIKGALDSPSLKTCTTYFHSALNTLRPDFDRSSYKMVSRSIIQPRFFYGFMIL